VQDYKITFKPGSVPGHNFENIYVNGSYWGQRAWLIYAKAWYVVTSPDALQHENDIQDATLGVTIGDSEFDRTIRQLIVICGPMTILSKLEI
jgi:hypothetical protein